MLGNKYMVWNYGLIYDICLYCKGVDYLWIYFKNYGNGI